ncbi:conserved Plasmodium protein, unknown function [Plasmodium berghei]|uniref:Uncharacterized protein n=3 Tax=Plasmodium berghei TaxID=5821 RepID=A0A509AUV1_PLABA|nr:conserved Plasmodium protein, unknown function [Plasmodium berghei ANKA]SCM25427.1 conserved Plasmodium protein, unknown function [Plasmodium berghei]SCO63790.1 conserved Plasmodium protein, unknown function [Plasmodium berghei]VUC57218.1 conserved Plasmodium protein, unknown function [Plasmodium berghei ANKA]|eukprot:XP_034422997.1 conserved Plasmodium protein, unknown function [Plasmodium berghei ANKA]
MQYLKGKTIATLKYDDNSSEKNNEKQKKSSSYFKMLHTIGEKSSLNDLSYNDKKKEKKKLKAKTSNNSQKNIVNENSFNEATLNKIKNEYDGMNDRISKSKLSGKLWSQDSDDDSNSSIYELEEENKKKKNNKEIMENNLEDNTASEDNEYVGNQSNSSVYSSENRSDTKNDKNKSKDTEIKEENTTVLGIEKKESINKKGGSVFERLYTSNKFDYNKKRSLNSKLKKQFTENIYSIMEKDKGGNKPKKSFSIRLDKNVTYSSFMPYNKARKENLEKKLNIMRAKSQVLKIAEMYMGNDKLKSLKMIEKGNTQSFDKSKKKIGLKKMQTSDPFFLLHKNLEENNIQLKKVASDGPNDPKAQSIKDDKFNNIKSKVQNKANVNKFNYDKYIKLRKYVSFKNKTKMILAKKSPKDNLQGFRLFDNMIGINNFGKLYFWNGYKWKNINIFYEHFISACTNKNGQIICINNNYKPGYLLMNKSFKKIDTCIEEFFFKIAISNKNKIWGINLRGDLQKWNLYQWIVIKKAYGISKLKSLAFDRNNKLWVLDQRNYFYIYDTEYKNWMLRNVNGANIKDFDFNEDNLLIAVTNDGVIKIFKNHHWIKYGILGEMKIASLHFLRNAKRPQIMEGIKPKEDGVTK